MKLKHLLRYPLDIRLARRQLAYSGTQPDVGFRAALGLDLYRDVMTLDCGRHLACLAASARHGNVEVVLRCGRLTLAAIAHKRWGKHFLAMTNVRWIESDESFPQGTPVLVDVDRRRTDRPYESQPVVEMLIGRDVFAGTAVMPYPMHPNQIEQLSDVMIDRLRAMPKAGIFFAGNQKSRYGRDQMSDRFGVLSRLDVLDELKSQYPDRIVPRQADGVKDRIVIRDSQSDPIDPQDWMTVLSRHEFFLCPPGASQPMCHNAIESMAIGMIPLLEYGDRFHPNLVDGVNAICFKGRQGLADAIGRIDSLSRSDRCRLRANVCAYFDEHLRGDVFLSRLLDASREHAIQRISMPFHDRNLYETEFGRDRGHPPRGRVAA